MWMVWICSTKIETDTFLFPDIYANDMNMFGEVMEADTFLFPDIYANDMNMFGKVMETNTFLYPDDYVDIRICSAK